MRYETWSRLEFSCNLVQATGPDAFPQRFGLVGDLGQTENSSSTLGHLIGAAPPVCGAMPEAVSQQWPCSHCLCQ